MSLSGGISGRLAKSLLAEAAERGRQPEILLLVINVEGSGAVTLICMVCLWFASCLHICQSSFRSSIGRAVKVLYGSRNQAYPSVQNQELEFTLASMHAAWKTRGKTKSTTTLEIPNGGLVNRDHQIGDCIPLTTEKTRTASEDRLPLSFPFEYSIVDCRKY